MAVSTGYDLTRFGLGDMSACGLSLREVAEKATDLPEAAERVVRFLYERLLDASGERATALVRLFATAPFGELDADDQAFAREQTDTDVSDTTPCLKLLATAGNRPDWNDPAASRGHRALPLPSNAALARSPMLSQLLAQFGVDLENLTNPDAGFLVGDSAAFNVFHVAEADGSPYVPAQDFVREHGIASVLGFGAMLPTGSMFAVIAFATVPISRDVAERFQSVALQTKLGLLSHLDPTPFPGGASAEQIRIRALEELLAVHQRTVAVQGRELEESNRRIRRLADAAVVVNEARTVQEVLALLDEHAQRIVGAHQAVSSLTVGSDWAQAITDVRMSDKYARWADYDEAPDGSGIYRLVVAENRPMRLTQSELEAHPDYLGFGPHAADHPPMRGWLAVPLIARDGTNLGLIQLSDRYTGDFTAEDEAVLVQLAHVGALAIENLRLAAAEALREGERFREDILAGVTHDMKTPVAAMVGLAETLGLGLLDPAEQEAAQQALIRQSRALRRLVMQFLDYARLEAGRTLELQLQTIEVARAIEEATSLFSHQREFVVETPGSVPEVVGDDARLAQVLGNLVSNAVKFSPPDDPITVTVDVEPSHVVVAVHDRGPGVDPADAHHLFQKFYRGAHTERQPGSGLGLYLSRLLVEAMGGTIRHVAGHENDRTTFAVRLRRADAHGEARGSADAVGGA